MNSMHSVKLRQKTLVRLRGLAADLETSVSAVIKYAVEETINDAWRNAALAIPVRSRAKPEAKDAFDARPHPVKLEPETEARLRSIAAQRPVLKVSSILRGAVERFVDRAHRDEQVVIRFQPELQHSSRERFSSRDDASALPANGSLPHAIVVASPE